MSACALLVVGVLALSFVRGRVGLRAAGLGARPALWREFLADEYPRADQKSGAHNRRRGERGEILQHEGSLDLAGQSRSAGCCARPSTLPAGTGAGRPSVAVAGRTSANKAVTPHQDARKTLTSAAACGCFPVCSA